MIDILKKENTDSEDTSEIFLSLVEEYVRKEYLAWLSDAQVLPVDNRMELTEDVVDNIRLYKVNEMVYRKGEPIADKLTTVFNTMSAYSSSVFIVIDSDGDIVNFYIGVRNNEKDEERKRSTVTLGDTLNNTLVGNFPGILVEKTDRNGIIALSKKIKRRNNVASVSVAGSDKQVYIRSDEQFVQGIEKLILAMQGREYIGLIIAEHQSAQEIQAVRNIYQGLYSKLSPLQRIQISSSKVKGSSAGKSFVEMSGKQKAAKIGETVASISQKAGVPVVGMLGGFVASLVPGEAVSASNTSQKSSTYEYKRVSDLMEQIDSTLKRTTEFDSYGMWKVAGYFVSNDMSTSEIAASNYRSLMSGEDTGRELSAINSWRNDVDGDSGDYLELTYYLSRFMHPRFRYGNNTNIGTDATTMISGKELGLHLGFPRSSVPGLPVIEHAEFGKEVSLSNRDMSKSPEDRMTLGKVFDLGRTTEKTVELENKSLTMHTFITGSTGAGKSNAVYQMLNELYQDRIPFLVVEPAKGEYKDVFGTKNDVNVFSTNPDVAELIHINPFAFPNTIHVLEHVDGLVEIFSVCWPMYDAMSAFLKEAILESYKSVGWDLTASRNEKSGKEKFPDFRILVDKLNQLIEHSGYSKDVQSNYRGALTTRVKSLTVGLNEMIFSSGQTPYKKIFDENCILDISRVKSAETKALIMGLVVYTLNEYRMHQKKSNNSKLKHVTVLEEAHNLLKNTSGGRESELISKSVEMLTQTIAEIRTYGEGFVIVDQSPSSVDISAIKNTNTKIVLRTPEAHDRDAVGRSMGLTEDQINEISRLQKGVAVVYQNDWLNPVLTMINKAEVNEDVSYESIYRGKKEEQQRARHNIARALIRPDSVPVHKWQIEEALDVLNIHSEARTQIEEIVRDYEENKEKNAHNNSRAGHLLRGILGIEEEMSESRLRSFVEKKVGRIGKRRIEKICNAIKNGGEQNA